MKVNWKIRFKNKLWLMSFISAMAAIVYTVFDVLGIFPNLTEASMLRLADAVLLILSLLGVVIDPTTAGINDSNRACGYEEPWNDLNQNTIQNGGNG